MRIGFIILLCIPLSIIAEVEVHCKNLPSQPNALLRSAARNGDLQLAEKALACGADVNNAFPATAGEQEPALLAAARNNHPEMVTLLLNKGADANFKEPAGNYTPLFFAAREGNIDIMCILIEHGADVNAKSNYGTDILTFTIWAKKEPLEAVKLLIAHKANVNLQNFRGGGLESALSWAIDNQYFDTAKLLIENGVRFADKKICESKIYPRKKLCNSNEFLAWATRNNHLEILNFLLMYEINLDDKDQNGWTALDYAKAQKNGAAVAILESMKKHVEVDEKLEELKKYLTPNELIHHIDSLKKKEMGGL